MKAKDIKILYMGTPLMSAKLLEHLIKQGFNIVAVVAQPDQKVGRKQILEEVPTKVVAKSALIPVYQLEKIRKQPEEVLNIDFDLILCFAYGQIIPTSILNKGKFKPLNFHGSLLPKYRGAAPIQYALMNNEKETGVCLMEMVEKMDAGDVYSVERITINDDDNYETLSNKIVTAAIELTSKLDDYVNNKLVPIPQKEDEVTYAPSIKPEQERININDKLTSICGLINGLAPKPGAYLYIGDLKLKVFKVGIINQVKYDGEAHVVKADKQGFHLQLNEGVISLITVQKPSKNIVGFKDFLNGERDILNKKVA